MNMVRRCPLTALLALTLVASAMPAHAQSDDERYTIMKPEKLEPKSEPWLAPRYNTTGL
jgi:hypothetical protein